MFSFLLKVICYGALLAYVGWAIYALYRAVFKAGKKDRKSTRLNSSHLA